MGAVLPPPLLIYYIFLNELSDINDQMRTEAV